MSNETLSMEKAKKIVDTAADLVLKANAKTRNKGKDFEAEIAKIWEDQRAVEFISTFWRSISEVLDNNKKQFTRSAETVKNIAEAYRQVGGMQRIVFIDTTLPVIYSEPLTLPFNKVSETFFGTDEFGFKNLDTGPGQCIDAFSSVRTELLGVYGEIADGLNQIEAFGNTDVQNAIDNLWKSMMDTLLDNLQTIENSCKTKVEEAANEYRKTGQNAEGSSSIKLN